MELLLANITLAKAIVFLVGGGGFTSLAVAWLGWKSRKKEESEKSQPGVFSAMFADRMAFERLSTQLERLGTIMERSIEINEKEHDREELKKMIRDLKGGS